MFFTYDQNNSSGVFKEPAMYVIVEADSAVEANHVAEAVDVYFDGCEKGIDCGCCGDRWHEEWSDNAGTGIPSIYDQPVSEYQNKFRQDWADKDGIPLVMVFYANGTVETF